MRCVTYGILLLVVRCALSILWVGANSVEANPDDSKTFTRYFDTNWVGELPFLEDSWPIPIAANRDIVAIVESNGCLTCIDRQTGRTKWQARSPLMARAVPVVSDKHVFALTRGTSSINAYHIDDGKSAWAISLGPAPIALGRHPAFVAYTNIVYAITTNGVVTALTEHTGGLLWSRAINAVPDVLPVIWQDRLFVSVRNIGVLALDAHTGDELWRCTVDSLVLYDFITDASALYFVSSPFSCTSQLNKISCATGDVVWKATIPRPQLAPLFVGNKIAVIGDVTAGVKACLITVDPISGKLLDRRMCPRVAMSAFYDGRSLWCATAFQELFLYDGSTMCPRIVLQCLPAPLRVVPASLSPLLIAGRKVIVGGINEAAIHQMKQRGMMGGEASAPLFVSMTIFILGAVAMIWMSFSGGSTIPPTHETTGFMYGWCILVGVASCSLILDSLLVARIIGHAGATFIRVISIPALLLPPVGLLAGWIGTGFHFRHLLALREHPYTAPHDTKVLESFVYIVNRLRLGMRVELLTLHGAGFSPYVVRHGFKRNVLVVPCDLYAMCERACDNDSRLAKSLIRVILAHEMSHLVTRDVLVLPMVRLFRLFMLLSIGLLSGIFLAAIVQPDEVLKDIVRPALVLGFVVSIVAIVLRARFGHARERVADAIATQVVPPGDLEVLLTPIGQRPSPLEALLFILSMAPSVVSARRRFQCVPFAISSKTIMRLRKDAAERRVELSARHYLLPRHAHNVVIAVIVASLLAGLIYQILANILQTTMSLFDVPLAIAYGRGSAAIWAEWIKRPSLLSAALWALAPLLSAMAATSTLLLPLRDAFFQDLRANPKVLKRLLGMIVVCAVLAEIISHTIGRLMAPVRVVSYFTTVSGIPCGVALVFGGILTLVAILVRWAAILKQSRRGVILVSSMLLVILVLSCLMFSLLTGISETARILLAVISAAIAAIVSSLFSRGFIQSGYAPDEWMSYDRGIVGLKLTIDHPAHPRHLFKRAVMRGISIGVINYLVIMVLVACAAYPLLVGFESWYDQYLPLLYRKAAELSLILGGDASPAMISLIRDYGFSVLLVAMTEVLSITAAEALLWQILLLILILLIAWLVVDVVRSYASPLTRVAYIPSLHRLSRILATSLVPAPMLHQYNRVMLWHMSATEPYLQWPRQVPRMKGTCQALPLVSPEIPEALRISSAEWVRRCGDSGGGFGCAPGEQPNPLHTHAALELLLPMGILSAEEITRHLHWIIDKVGEMVAVPDSYPPATFLSYAALLLESQALISREAVTLDQQVRLQKIILQYWRRSEQTIEDTRNAVVALHYLEIKSELFFEELRGNWLPSKENEVIRIDPKTRIEDILYVVEVESSLYPDDFRSRACIAQLTSILAATFGAQKGDSFV